MMPQEETQASYSSYRDLELSGTQCGSAKGRDELVMAHMDNCKDSVL